MSVIKSDIEIYEYEDANGNITKSTLERTTKIEKSGEPDYIKIYTQMWCEFNQIQPVYRQLFLELALRMSYADVTNDEGGQIVMTGAPISTQIMTKLGWKSTMWYKGLKALCECGAIRKINRGAYQINPSYAGRGLWKYNPKKRQGGIENIIAKFNVKEGSVDTQIIWADDGMNTNLNQQYRDGLGVEKGEIATLTKTTYNKTAAEQESEITGQIIVNPNTGELQLL